MEEKAFHDAALVEGEGLEVELEGEQREKEGDAEGPAGGQDASPQEKDATDEPEQVADAGEVAAEGAEEAGEEHGLAEADVVIGRGVRAGGGGVLREEECREAKGLREERDAEDDRRDGQEARAVCLRLGWHGGSVAGSCFARIDQTSMVSDVWDTRCVRVLG